jgi:Transglycosylase SLT domain
MLVDPSTSAVGSTVTGAIRQASAATGTSFNYLLATARVESGLNPQAGASTSSARGLFQFIEQTWLGTMKQSGAELGYGRYAAAITQTASGHYQVTDPEMRKEILALRNDPTANATMAGAFTRANADILSKKLGRAPSEGELYIAHFLGAGGAARLISLASSDPNAKATQYFPNAATANSSIFFDRSTGTARTMAQVRNVLTARYDVAARGSAADPVQTAQLTVSAASAKAPDTAGITSAFAAATPVQMPESSSPATVPGAAKVQNQNQMFHGLFQDTDRASPVAAIVSQLWTTPLVPVDGGSGQGSRQGDLRDLFSDTDQRS